MKIQDVNIETIIPYAKNPRQNDEAIAKVASSLKEFGWRQPIVVDKEMVVIAGHTRLGAATRLGYKKVPIHVATDLTDNQIKAYRIADNRVGQEAKWDEDLLSLELKDLEIDGYDLEQTGFNDEELNALLAEAVTEGLVDEDQVPPEPEESTSVLGDVWLLGNHRVMCGDSTSIDDLDLLTENQKADMVFTDPPYNIGFKGTMSNTSKNGIMIKHIGMNSKYDEIKNDKKKSEEFKEFITNIISIISMKCIGGWYICFASSSLNEILTPLIENEMKWKSIIIWNKNQSPMGGGHFRKKYEPIIYGYFNNLFYGQEYSEDDVWDIKRTVKNDLHPTMKPIELVEKAVLYSSKIKNTVLDLFGGSGSTLIACEKTNRKARLMELDPKYVDVIIQRWQDFTGKKATHEKTNKTFDEMKNGSNNIST